MLTCPMVPRAIASLRGSLLGMPIGQLESPPMAEIAKQALSGIVPIAHKLLHISEARRIFLAAIPCHLGNVQESGEQRFGVFIPRGVVAILARPVFILNGG